MKRFFPRWLSILLGALLTASCSRAQFPAAPGTGTGLPETIEAIDAARVTTRILYITAHPDDESAAVLTYLARGLHADVALLSLTRGEGGQNALGPEQAPQLGLIRTQELLAATRGYGVKLYFTRAKDFGYSKTPAETEKIWGDQVLEDVVRVIREFRPNIVINGWGGVHSGHGHHQTAGLWTPEAVKLAADPKYLAEPNFPAWDNNGVSVKILDVERSSENPKGYVLPVDEISPLYGKSYREIGLDAFVNHRTQGIAGFLSSPFLHRPVALLPEDGSKLDSATLSVSLTATNSENGPCGCDEELKKVDRDLEAARASALKLDWPSAVNSLISAERSIQKATLFSIPYPVPPALMEKLSFLHLESRKLDHALELALGLTFWAEVERADVVVDEELTLNISSHCRSGIGCTFGQLHYHARLSMKVDVPSGQKVGAENSPEFSSIVTFGKQEIPGWLTGPKCSFPSFSGGSSLGLTPEPNPLLQVGREVQVRDFAFCAWTPASHTISTSTSVVRVPLRLVPAYTLAVEPAQTVEVLNAPHKPFDVLLRAHSYSTKPAKISVGLDVPDGLRASAPVELSFDGIGDHYAKLNVTPPTKFDAGNFTITAYAKRGDEKFSTSLTPLPSMPTILWSESAQTIVHAFDINVPANLHVGYISAESEPIPDALKRLGISVDLLDPTALAFGDLSKFDAIVVGVRAYELRPELTGANKRLLDYVEQGGTLIAQYNRDFVWDKLQPAPYPAKIGSPTPRTTDEHSPVKFLKPDDSLLNQPNKITQADFNNWVQERGLYYWSDFDSRYTPLLAMNDPGESDLNGALVYTRYGKGTYIYTGLAFFRELPEGVPGAYRLFVNLLAASKSK